MTSTKRSVGHIKTYYFGTIAFFVISLFCSYSTARPPESIFDARINMLCVAPPSLEQANLTSYAWRAAVPKQLFQIWFGPLGPHWQSRAKVWADYATRFGYAYRLYTDADIAEILSGASTELVEKFSTMLQMKELRGASDIARYLLLDKEGGIYLDLDMNIPTYQGSVIDFRVIAPMRGLVVVTDGEPVDWGKGGIHVLNGIIASPPRHPAIHALIGQLAQNIDCVLRAGDRNPVLMTGPAIFNQFLVGPVTVIPTVFWDTLGLPDSTWR